MTSVTPNELYRGDRFMEDTYPEIWEVIGPGRQCGIRARVVGYLEGFPGKPDRLGEESDWWGEGMTLYLLRH